MRAANRVAEEVRVAGMLVPAGVLGPAGAITVRWAHREPIHQFVEAARNASRREEGGAISVRIGLEQQGASAIAAAPFSSSAALSDGHAIVCHTWLMGTMLWGKGRAGTGTGKPLAEPCLRSWLVLLAPGKRE